MVNGKIGTAVIGYGGMGKWHSEKMIRDMGERMELIGIYDIREERCQLARENGILTIQAHPFRMGMVTTHPNEVDGIEVFNGHPGHNSNNDIAEAWAKKYGKIMTSGTDHHNPDHMPDGGILTDEPITSEKQLIEVLRSGNYDLIREMNK